jgi:tetratricopeptide (TPR) repeat protein
MGRAYEQLGRPREAIEAYLAPLGFAERNRDMVETLRAAADRGGLEEFWTVRLRHLLEEPDVRTAAVAAAYVTIGDHDRAFEWLEKLLVERGAWIVGLKVQPQWDPLRSDPRFHDLLRRANLAPLTAPPPSHQP